MVDFPFAKAKGLSLRTGGRTIECSIFCLYFRLIPESFRWYYSHDRIEEAERVIKAVSKVNRRPSPDMAFMEQLAVTTKDRKYTVIDLFKSRFLIRITALLSLNW